MPKPNKDSEPFDIAGINRILSVLANEDALKILIAAKEGISNSTNVIRELGLTQKRYYTRLKELTKTGLIEKNDEVYRLTTIGMICYNLSDVFNNALKSRSYLDLSDALRKSKSLSTSDTNQILQSLSSKGIIDSLGIDGFIHPVKMIDNYEQLVTELVNMVDKAEKNIYLASHYNDPKVMDRILNAVQRNVKFSLLSWEENISEKLADQSEN